MTDHTPYSPDLMVLRGRRLEVVEAIKTVTTRNWRASQLKTFSYLINIENRIDRSASCLRESTLKEIML